MNTLCVGSADTMRAYLWTHSTFQKPDKLLWMLRDRFEKACSSQGVLGKNIRLRRNNTLKRLNEHVWWIETEHIVAAVDALQSFMRLLEGYVMKTHSRWLGDALARVTSGVGMGAECVAEKYIEVISSLFVLNDSALEPHLLDFSPLELARQTTFYTSDLFPKIRLFEFLKSTSNATNDERVNVGKINDFTNHPNDNLSALLHEPDVRRRAHGRVRQRRRGTLR